LSGGPLALAGTAAANAAGTFDVSPGMAIEDARGRTIGEVQSVRTTANGMVDSVIVEVGNRTASLPAANFSGSGDVLVSALSKGELKQQANDQSSGSSASAQQSGSGNASGNGKARAAKN
jgi:hypothetical protein